MYKRDFWQNCDINVNLFKWDLSCHLLVEYENQFLFLFSRKKLVVSLVRTTVDGHSMVLILKQNIESLMSPLLVSTLIQRAPLKKIYLVTMLSWVQRLQ